MYKVIVYKSHTDPAIFSYKTELQIWAWCADLSKIDGAQHVL